LSDVTRSALRHAGEDSAEGSRMLIALDMRVEAAFRRLEELSKSA
jgi:hypothetical protein